MKLIVLNMVSQRCKAALEAALTEAQITYDNVELGMAELPDGLSDAQRDMLKNSLQKVGLELHEDKKSIAIGKIKSAVAQMINDPELPAFSYSHYLSKETGIDYTHLAQMFSETEGLTIQQFIINRKVERVKELLVNKKMTLTDISYKLNYSSVAHLSNQFRKVTGMTPTIYRQMYTARDENDAL